MTDDFGEELARAINEHDRHGRSTANSTTCSECGTVKIQFDPPLAIEISDDADMCRKIKPGTYGAGPMPVPVCVLLAGHDGKHLAILEYDVRWAS